MTGRAAPGRPDAGDGAERSRADGPLVTPDGRYLVVRGRLWRASNPALSPDARRAHVDALMDARRAVAAALRSGDADRLRAARRDVQAAKVALGERGPPWWDDGAPDLNRRMARTTSYADWYAAVASTGPTTVTGAA